MTGQAENETSLARPETERVTVLRTEKLLTAGGVVGALAASSCCIVPLVLFGLGVSDAACALSALLHRSHGGLPRRRLLAALPLSKDRVCGW